MGILKKMFGKSKSILSPEDQKTLRDMEAKAYFEEAKKIVEQRGKEKAQEDLMPKKKVVDPYG